MYVPTPFQFTFLHIYFVWLDFQLLSLTGVVMRCQRYGCIWNALSYFCSLVSSTHKHLVLRLTAQKNRWIALLVYNYIQQPWVNEGNRMHDAWGWGKASLLVQGFIVGICKGAEKLIEYGWSVVRFTIQWFTDPPKPSGWYRKYIQRKNNRGGVSQWGRIDVIKSDQTDLIVPFVCVKLVKIEICNWMDEMGTMKFILRNTE